MAYGTNAADHIARELARKIGELPARLDYYLDKSGECWIWTAAHDGRGYGVLCFAGRQFKAHRIAWEVAYGPIPTELQVAHRCNNKRCCRPDHLYIATRKQNAEDAVRDGLYRRGDTHGSRLHPESLARGKHNGAHTHPEKVRRGDEHWTHQHPQAAEKVAAFQQAGTAAVRKLTDDQVREIRALSAAGGISQEALGARFGITQASVWRIVHRMSWPHLE